MKKILLTAISGYGGSGTMKIAKELQDSGRQYKGMRIIGADATASSVGEGICDKVYDIPLGGNKFYIERILQICKKEKIDLIFPGHENQVFALAKFESENPGILPKVVCSPFETVEPMYDKYLSCKKFKEKGLPFAESYLPSEYKGQFERYIVKKRSGTNQKVFVNPENLHAFSDEYVIQKFHEGVEVALVFYVNKMKEVVGSITICEQGEPQNRMCRIVKKYDQLKDQLVQDVVDSLPMQGTGEIEAIVDSDSGKIIPFEINCRISNTTGLRSKFGFEDVRYAIDELLFGRKVSGPIKTWTGFTERIKVEGKIPLDVIYFDRDMHKNSSAQKPSLVF